MAGGTGEERSGSGVRVFRGKYLQLGYVRQSAALISSACPIVLNH